jgi:hypothetical protein
MVAAAPLDELEETEVGEAVLDAAFVAPEDAELPVAEGELPVLLLPPLAIVTLAGLNEPQSACWFAWHSACPLAFWRLAAMQFWYTCSQRKYGMVWI